MSVQVHAADHPGLTPLQMPDRFRRDVCYFMATPGEADVPTLPAGEYWIRQADAERWLDEGVFYILSPLDSENQAEIELTEEQEDWLRWMVANHVQHIRVC